MVAETVINWVLGVIALASGSAVFVYMFRVNYAKQTIDYLRGDRDDAIVRADGFQEELKNVKERHVKEIADFQAKILSYETALSTKDQEIHILRGVVTGKDQLDRIEKLLDSLYKGKFT